jgi:hypothetical protein
MQRLARATLIGATITSAAAALLGLAWMVGLWPSVYADADAALLARLAGQDAATTVHVVTALTGVAGGIAGLAGALGRRGRAWAAALQLMLFGVVLQGSGPLSTMGCLVAMAMPLAVVVLLAQVVRRYRVARWTVGVPGLADNRAGLLLSLLVLAIGTLWAATGVQALAGHHRDRAVHVEPELRPRREPGEPDQARDRTQAVVLGYRAGLVEL